MRSNKEEFLSYLGTCMSFYKMHLTQTEQDSITQNISDILREYMDSRQRMHLVSHLMYLSDSIHFIYEDTDSIKIGGETNGKDDI